MLKRIIAAVVDREALRAQLRAILPETDQAERAFKAIVLIENRVPPRARETLRRALLQVLMAGRAEREELMQIAVLCPEIASFEEHGRDGLEALENMAGWLK